MRKKGKKRRWLENQRNHINNNSEESDNCADLLWRVNISLLVYTCPYVHVSTYSIERLVLDRFSWKFVPGYFTKNCKYFRIFVKIWKFVALIDSYVYLLCYLAVKRFIIYRDFVLCEVGSEHLNLTIKHVWYKSRRLQHTD